MLNTNFKRAIMKVKVCGLNNPANILNLEKAGIDLFGFIFYKKSPRYYNKALDHAIIREMPFKIRKVGVFVNENEYEIVNSAATYSLDYIQLHGDESTQLCKQLQCDFRVIKAFSVAEKLDIEKLKRYQEVCDYFLFDTKSKLRGGSGHKFDWRLLDEYNLDKPFFLSGGIANDDADVIRNLQHPKLAGIDINSRFEIVPGTKDVELVKEFIKEIKH